MGRGSNHGRPRSEAVDVAIQAATLDLLDEVGYRGMAIEQVAARAGVGKAAIYRRWRSKAELVFSQVIHDLDSAVPRDTGSLRGDLAELVAELTASLDRPIARKALPGLVGDLATEPDVASRFAETFNVVQRKVLAEVLDRAVTRGELPRRPDPVEVHTLLVGPIFTWLFLYGRPASTQYSEHIAHGLHAAVCALAEGPPY